MELPALTAAVEVTTGRRWSVGSASGVQTPAAVTVRTAVTAAVVEVTPLTAVQTT